MSKTERIRRMIMGSSYYNQGEPLAVSYFHRSAKFIDPTITPDDVRNTLRQMREAQLVWRDERGTWRKVMANQWLRKSWRSRSSIAHLEPLLSIPAHMAGPVSVIEYAKTDGGMVA